MKSTLTHVNPFTPDISAIAEVGGAAYSIMKYNQALTYAATTTSRTFGTQFLMYPNKSSVFRSLMKDSAKGSFVGVVGALDISLFQGLLDEIDLMRQGKCQ